MSDEPQCNCEENATDPYLVGAGETKLTIPVYLELDTLEKRLLVYIILFLGGSGNILTILKICFDSKLHKSTFLAIMLLAVADLCTLIHYFVQVLLVVSNEEIRQFSGKLFMTLYYIVTHSSAAHLVGFLLVRYYTAADPLKVLHLRMSVLFKASLLIWILSGMFGGFYYIFRFELIHLLCEFAVVMTFRVYLLIVPVCIILILHAKKVRVLRRSVSLRTRRRMTSSRMSVMTGLIVCIYLSSAILYPVCFVFASKQICVGYVYCKVILMVARVMWLINSAINPVLYFLFSPPIYRFIKKTLRKMPCCCI
ncbi:hypothetical protein FSP39_023401 [Pinctada imbricata]|uniref:G-protein coupled receptors family 1 profile domain-containing protein n=1 Tax=Pinctada imbricata TaxID=66713 RepID=A0AA89C503_PINIB|nr:hypothetical protein FSP39_023401 [Pinctada imbricata]